MWSKSRYLWSAARKGFDNFQGKKKEDKIWMFSALTKTATKKKKIQDFRFLGL